MYGKSEERLNAARTAGKELVTIEGRTDVLISAPHHQSHVRDGRIKVEDRDTGLLALALADATGAWAVTTARPIAYDPNWDPADPYKDRVRDIVERAPISLVVDLHGMRDRECDIELGTGHDRAVAGVPLDSLIASLAPYHVLANVRFAAAGANTVTQFARRQGAASLQVEIATHLRSDRDGWPQLVESLSRLVRILHPPQ